MWKIWCSVGWCNKVTSFRTSAYMLQQNVLSFSYWYSKFTPFSVMIQHLTKQAIRSNISLQYLSCDLVIRNYNLFEAQSWSYTRLILRALVQNLIIWLTDKCNVKGHSVGVEIDWKPIWLPILSSFVLSYCDCKSLRSSQLFEPYVDPHLFKHGWVYMWKTYSN